MTCWRQSNPDREHERRGQTGSQTSADMFSQAAALSAIDSPVRAFGKQTIDGHSLERRLPKTVSRSDLDNDSLERLLTFDDETRPAAPSLRPTFVVVAWAASWPVWRPLHVICERSSPSHGQAYASTNETFTCLPTALAALTRVCSVVAGFSGFSSRSS